MNQVVVMVECTSRKESYDFFEKLCETFNLLYSNEFESSTIAVDLLNDSNDAINSYPVIEKFMKWYGA